MRTVICTAVSIILLLSASTVLACSLSHGESEKDKQVAARLCKVFRDIPDIRMMSVQESILYVDITKQFYKGMMADKLEAKKLIKLWMRGMRQEHGRPSVTVWIYVDKIKVIEGDTSWTGEDKISFL